MKFLKKFNEINENVDNDNNKTLYSYLKSDELKKYGILNYLGFDSKKISLENEDKYECIVYINTEYLEDIMNIEHDIIRYYVNFDYYDYDDYFEDDELNYLHNYLSSHTIGKIENLAKKFNYFEDDFYEYSGIYNFYDYLGLKENLNEYLNEIRHNYSRQKEKYIKNELESLPFKFYFLHVNKYDLEVTFDYDKIVDCIEKNNIFNVKTIKEFLEKVSWDLSYDIYVNIYFNDKDKSLENYVEYDIEFFDENSHEIFPFIICKDNLDAFKDNIKYAKFYDCEYKKRPNEIYYNYDLKSLFDIAHFFNKKIFKYIISDEFITMIEEVVDSETFNKLMNDIDEYNFKHNMDIFNL